MNWIIRNVESPLIDYRYYISIDIISLTSSSSFFSVAYFVHAHMDFPRHRHQTSLDSPTMGCPYLFRRGWPRSYHWDAVRKVDDVDLPRCHSWVKRHPKNLGLSRSKEPGCMGSAHGFQLGLWNEVWIWYVLKGLTFSISVSKFTLFQLVSNICEFPQPPLLQNLSRQHVHATGPSIMAQLESRLGFVNHR